MSGIPNQIAARGATIDAPDEQSRSVDELLGALEASPEAREKIDDLRDKLYGHVVRTIDMDALFAVEQLLWGLVDRAGVHDEESELASALLSEAFARVAYDPACRIRSEPHGITDEEIIAAEHDPECELCQHDLAEAKRRTSGESDRFEDWADAELLATHAEAAKRWRKEHAEALRRFGINPANRT